MYSIKHLAELLNYPNMREELLDGTYADIWDGSAVKTANISKDDIVFLTNYDPFNPFGLTTKYSCATFTSKIANVPLGFLIFYCVGVFQYRKIISSFSYSMRHQTLGFLAFALRFYKWPPAEKSQSNVRFRIKM